MSEMLVILRPHAFSARTADSRPGPGPPTRTSTFFTPCSCAATPAFWGVLLTADAVLGLGAAALLAREGELRHLFRPAWGDFSRAFLVAVVLYAAAVAFRKFALPPGSPAEGWLVHVYLHVGDPRSVRAHVGLFALGLSIVVLGEECRREETTEITLGSGYQHAHGCSALL